MVLPVRNLLNRYHRIFPFDLNFGEDAGTDGALTNFHWETFRLSPVSPFFGTQGLRVLLRQSDDLRGLFSVLRFQQDPGIQVMHGKDYFSVEPKSGAKLNDLVLAVDFGS